MSDAVVERVFARIFREVKGVELALPLPRMTWIDAMENYGSDKPDTRFGMKLVNLTERLGKTRLPGVRFGHRGRRPRRGDQREGAGVHDAQGDRLAGEFKTYRAKGLAVHDASPPTAASRARSTNS